jgi:hypothetical protein
MATTEANAQSKHLMICQADVTRRLRQSFSFPIQEAFITFTVKKSSRLRTLFGRGEEQDGEPTRESGSGALLTSISGLSHFGWK